MKKFYRIIILFFILIFLTTYSPINHIVNNKKENNFFKIKIIEIENNNLIKDNEIYNKLNKIYGKDIFFIKREDIERPLKTIEFLERIEVKKKYPSTIILKVYETRPIAIFFNDNKKYLIDSNSNLLSYREELINDDLPKVFGNKAERYFLDFFYILKKNNFPNHKIKNFYYFKIGRWDLQLLNDQIIKLPSDKILQAVQQSVELLNRSDFKKYNIIDLRIHGKIIVE